MIQRLNGRISLALAAAGLLLVVLVGWFGVVSPQRSKAAELAVHITRRRLSYSRPGAVRGPALQESKAELATLRARSPTR